jgi:hypothetical protein
LSTWTETLSWTKGAHAIKTGIEFRFGGSNSWVPSDSSELLTAARAMFRCKASIAYPACCRTTSRWAQNLLLSLSGSVDTVVQKFEIKEPTDTKFLTFKDTFYNDAIRITAWDRSATGLRMKSISL